MTPWQGAMEDHGETMMGHWNPLKAEYGNVSDVNVRCDQTFNFTTILQKDAVKTKPLSAVPVYCISLSPAPHMTKVGVELLLLTYNRQ